jgi:5-methylcytosine-specific restriction endonuclease McrA
LCWPIKNKKQKSFLKEIVISVKISWQFFNQNWGLISERVNGALKTLWYVFVNGECFMTQTSLELNTRAKSLAKDYLNTEGKLLDLLIQMKRKKVFSELNYTSIFDYCERALNLSRAQSFYFKSVADKSEEVPQIQKAIAQGNLTLSQARRIVPVITPQNQEAWIEKARTLTQKELEREVTEVNPKPRVIEKEAPEKRLERAEKRKSGNLSTVSSRKFSESKMLPRKRIPIPNRIKLQKLKLAQNQCSYTSADGPRCPQRLWLELHHVKPISKGGGNEMENLVYLCGFHHRNLHQGG